MKMRCRSIVVGSLMALVAGGARAEVKVVSERNVGGTASGEFKFKDVPAPSKTYAGNKGKWTVVAGRRDGNGGSVEVLNDGKLPSGEDVPGANFFFAAGTAGGRIVVDLGEATGVRQVNSYSWHRGTRGPQVYKLYGSEGNGAGFEAKPAAGSDPEKAGWKLVASVDTRPGEGEVGGQYGVSVADAANGVIGKFRYLLFDVSRTEDQDPFGNTFFSEIDVIDGKEHAAPVAGVPVGGAVDVVMAAGKYEITFDTTEVPELKGWVDEKLKPTCVEWYPKIVAMLPSEGYTAPEKFVIKFHKDMQGVANAAGTRINCAGEWFKRNLEGEAAGAVVHELVHVVQQYRRARGGNRNPGWLVEGLADYVRWFNYEPVEKRPRPNANRANYNDSYRTTGHFLDYVMRKYDPALLKKLNAAMREGKYAEQLWKEWTGKTVEELGAEWKESLRG